MNPYLPTNDPLYNDMSFMSEFWKTHPYQWKSLSETFGDGLTLKQMIGISKNDILYRKYMHFADYKFSTLIGALKCIQVNDDMILIHFTELSLYGVLTHMKYKDLVLNFRSDVDGAPFNPRQLILSDKKQKMVFIYSGKKESIISLKKYVSECFKSDITISESADTTEITLADLVATNYANACSMFEQLAIHISGKNALLVNNIHLQKKMTEHNFDYTSTNIADTINVGTVEDLGKMLKSIHANTVIINVGNHVGNQGNQVNNNAAAVDHNAKLAIAWIRQHPPADMSMDEYRGACNAATGIKVGRIAFGDLMHDEGYKKNKSPKKRTWVRA